MSDYAAFLARKQKLWTGTPLPPADLPTQLFDWQAAVTRWAMKKGRAAVFADCGLGKSFMQLAWAQSVPGRVLILAPLCVAEQTIGEGAKLGIEAIYARHHTETSARIVVTNYERLDKFDLSRFTGVVLDESSILKSFDGKTRTALIAACKDTPYRLCCTATPSPNDIAELANHAEFLGLQTRQEFLATWFVHDDEGWRMKRHARQSFFRWLASWAVAFRKPSDLGYSDEGFVLPALTIKDYVIEGGQVEGVLFPELGAKGLQGRLAARRGALEDRVSAVVDLVLKSFHDERGEERILSPVESREQGVGEGLSRRTREQRAATSMGAKQIRDERVIQEEGDCASEGLCPSESASQKEATSSALRDDDATVQGTALVSEEQVRNLRVLGYEQLSDVPDDRSLPQDKLRAWASLRELQFRHREFQEQHEVARASGRLPKWIVWCGLNEEQDALEAAFGRYCVSVQGRNDYSMKVSALTQWLNDPTVPIMLSKLSVLGFGMNFQHCRRMVFCGLSDSYESYYQGIRRCWRFGQKRQVEVTIVVSDAERAIVGNVRKKEAAADAMSVELLAAMRDFEREELAS